MNKSKILIFIIFLVMSFIALTDNSYSGQHSSIKWYKYNEGIKIAKKQKKNILIDFYADWCYWCKVMDEKVFSNQEVSDILKKKFVCIRVDTDSINEKIVHNNQVLSAQEFAASSGVRGLPTVLFMNKTGDPLLLLPGYVKKGPFISILNYIDRECFKNNIDINDYVEGRIACNGTRKKE